jgi:hypothetical protein
MDTLAFFVHLDCSAWQIFGEATTVARQQDRAVGRALEKNPDPQSTQYCSGGGESTLGPSSGERNTL